MAISPTENINVREMYLSDIVDIYNIESATYDFPWAIDIFRDCIDKKYDCFVATNYTKLLGYVVSSITPIESHILNLTIDENYRRLGIASNFLDLIINRAILYKSNSILLEAKITNLSARNLYKRFGFKIIGLRKNYYRVSSGREAAVIYKKNLD